MKKLLAVIVNFFRSLFRRSKPVIVEKVQPPPVLVSMPVPEPIKRVFARRPNKGKHPLHRYHFGTFSPLKPI